VLSRARAHERGSVLILMPAGVLIIIVLAAITIDFSHLYLERRELQSAASSAANDAVTLAVDIDSLRLGNDLEDSLDFAVANTAAASSLAAEGLVGSSVVVGFVNDGGQIGVEVTISSTVDYIFARAVPGGPTSKVVTASATAFLETG
jgi:Flp pilus assembly protein TadG